MALHLLGFQTVSLKGLKTLPEMEWSATLSLHTN